MDFIFGLLKAMPGSVAQGLIWGIMAIGVYVTYKILDLADLTVDGSLCTGAAVCVLLTLNGCPVPLAMLCSVLAGMAAGLITGLLHTACGIPAILAGILTQLALYSINLRIMGWGTDNGSKANLPISVDKYGLLVSSRYVRALDSSNPIWVLVIFVIAVIALLYWFFGTELGSALLVHHRLLQPLIRLQVMVIRLLFAFRLHRLFDLLVRNPVRLRALLTDQPRQKQMQVCLLAVLCGLCLRTL